MNKLVEIKLHLVSYKKACEAIGRGDAQRVARD